MDAAVKLAELLNLREAQRHAGSCSRASEDAVALAVYALLGVEATPRLKRKLKAWPQVTDEAEDLQQLAVVAFLAAYRADRIQPTADGRHSPESVGGYLWGICNNVFLRAVRRSQQAYVRLEEQWIEPASNGHGSHGTPQRLPQELEELISVPAADDEARVWEVLAAVQDRCRPEDIVLSFLQCCGFSVAELKQLLGIGRNVPAKAMARVGVALRKLLGLDTAQGKSSANTGPVSVYGLPASNSPLALLKESRYSELLDWLGEPSVRQSLLREAALQLGPSGAGSPPRDSFADRMLAFQAEGDWTWGLLAKEERLRLLSSDLASLRRHGGESNASSQLQVVERLRGQLAQLNQDFEIAVNEGDVDWLLPVAEDLVLLLDMTCHFTVMEDRYAALLDSSQRTSNRRLEMFALLGLSRANFRMDRHPACQDQARLALEIAQELDDRYGQAKALNNLGNGLYIQGHYAEATAAHSQALELQTSLGDLYGQGYSYNRLGLIQFLQGNFRDSQTLHERSLAIRMEIGDQQGVAVELCDLGNLHSKRGDITHAVQNWINSLAIMDQIGDSMNGAIVRFNLAEYDVIEGHYDQARCKLQRALKDCERIKDTNLQAWSWLGLAQVEIGVEDHLLARGHLNTALRLFASFDCRNGLSLCHYMLACSWTSEGVLLEASDSCGQALLLNRELGDLEGIANSSIVASHILQKVGVPDAERIHAAAIDMLARAGTTPDVLTSVFIAKQARFCLPVEGGYATPSPASLATFTMSLLECARSEFARHIRE